MRNTRPLVLKARGWELETLPFSEPYRTFLMESFKYFIIPEDKAFDYNAHNFISDSMASYLSINPNEEIIRLNNIFGGVAYDTPEIAKSYYKQKGLFVPFKDMVAEKFCPIGSEIFFTDKIGIVIDQCEDVIICVVNDGKQFYLLQTNFCLSRDIIGCGLINYSLTLQPAKVEGV